MKVKQIYNHTKTVWTKLKKTTHCSIAYIFTESMVLLVNLPFESVEQKEVAPSMPIKMCYANIRGNRSLTPLNMGCQAAFLTFASLRGTPFTPLFFLSFLERLAQSLKNAPNIGLGHTPHKTTYDQILNMNPKIHAVKANSSAKP